MKASDLRQMCVVKRWGIVDLPNKQSIAEHSYLTAMTAIHFCHLLGKSSLSVACMSYALAHDMEESFMGDWTGPVKRRVIDPKKYSDYAEAGMEKRFPDYFLGMRSRKNDLEVRNIVKLADLAEMYMDVKHAQSLGHPVFEVVSKRCKDVENYMGSMGLSLTDKSMIWAYCNTVVQEPTRIEE